MTRSEGLAEIGIGTQIERSLSLLVLELEIGTVSCQEASDERAALLVLSLGPQTHE